MSNIPNGPGELTWSWFSDVTGWSVDDVRAELIGVGVGVSSAVYRAHLEGDGCPESVIVKLPALDQAAVETAMALGLYRREVRFYAELATASPIRVPACHFAEIDDIGGSFVIVMEDLEGQRVVDQTLGMDLLDAQRVVDGLADWHAVWWEDVDGFDERGLAVPIGSPMYPAVLPGLFAEGWAKLVAEAPESTEPVREVGERFAPAIASLLQQLDQPPVTLLHGDFRADNMMFDADDRPIIFDFQITGTGAAVYDLAYFVTQSLDSDVADAHERNLFDRWRDRLVEAGCEPKDSEEMWEDYRAAALFCVVYPVVACRGMDLSDPRQMTLVETMMGRTARACSALDLLSLL